MEILSISEQEVVYCRDKTGVLCYAPRDVRNTEYREALNFTCSTVSSGDKYEAFPDLVFVNGYYIGIYSDGDSHAASDKQVLIVSKDFKEFDRSVFYDGTSFNTEDLQEVLKDGDSLYLKVFHITKVNGVIDVVANPIIDGYAMWSPLRNGKQTGYKDGKSSLVDINTNNVLYTLFEKTGVEFTESDFVEKSDNIFAVCRSNSGDIYYNTVIGGVVGTPNLLGIKGVQPNIVAMGDRVLLFVSDRFRQTGIFPSGAENTSKCNGIWVYELEDIFSSVNVRKGLQLSRFLSTDGGQPRFIPVNTTVRGLSYQSPIAGKSRILATSITLPSEF